MSASAVVGSRSRMIPLALVVDLACQKTYTDLMRLVDLLPSKADLEKKIELARFFSRTRNLFIRIEALTKWANTSSKVDKCEKISNFLEEQSMLLLDTANVLTILHHNHLISARLPPFAMVLAIDIFVNKTYTRLPKAIERQFIPNLPITEKDIRSSLIDLNRIIKYRLSISQMPRSFTNILIDKGRVIFTVPHEFKMTLTMLSESQNFPWRILDIEFLVADPKRSVEGSLVHPQQIQFLLTRVQSRILDRRFDKRPPLVHLYDMLHAFALSLQLDVLFEQAQHLRSRRPTDPFNIEEYRPGQLLKVIYWRGLSTCNYEAAMGPDGKMRPSIYSIIIHTDPIDSQRPLCVSHFPELNAEDAFRVGNYIQASCLSIENLLTRTIVVRAERMLNEINMDIIPLCPGPITLGDVPLSLCIPVLWPCLPHEYLHLRVDSTQGLIRASFPASDQQKCIPLLKDLEAAFNRPTTRRVTLDRSSSIECRAGNRGMRNLAADDKRWQSRLVEIFSHLRCLLGQWRVKWTNRGRIVKDCLPISIPMQKMGRYPPRHTGYLQLLERVKQERSLLSYIKLFPNDEYYLLCEVSPAVEGVLSVLYRYYLLKCTPLSTTVADLRVAPESRSLIHVSDDVVPDKDSQVFGIALQISHFFPLIGESAEILAGKLPSFSSLQFENKLNDLRKDIARIQCTASAKRVNRIRRLLDHLTITSGDEVVAAKRRRVLLERFPSINESTSLQPSDSLPTDVEMKEVAQPGQIQMPDISRLLASIEDDVVVNELNEQLPEYGIQHEGVVNDPLSGTLTVDIKSIPTTRLPIWAQSGVGLLYHYASRVVLISSARSTSSMKQSSSPSLAAFHSCASMRCWRLCISFKGLPANPDLLYQSSETPVNSLRDLTNFLHSVVTEWEGLCRLFAICAPVLDKSASFPPGLVVQLFDAKSLILAYGPGLHYRAHLSLNAQNRCVLQLGLHPGPFGLKENPDEESLPVYQQQRERDLFENPHCLIREHLEFMVERQKSIIQLCKFLSSTSDFMVTMEALRKPTIISNTSMSPIVVQSARPVRSMSLMALSCCDLNLVYRGTLCLRLTYKIPEHGNQGLVFFSDGCHNLDLGANPSPQKGGGISSEIYPVQGFVPLPALKQFLDSMKKAFNVEEGSMPWNAFTVSQLDHIVSNSKSDPEDPLAVTISPLEKYFSSSLIFHASNQVMSSLRWQISTPLDIDTGEFTAKSHMEKGIEVKVKMHQLDDPVEGNLPNWRLQLKVTSDVDSNYASNESGEFSARIEEFFRRRVCSVSPQASAITSFFRLLTLPLKTLYDLVSNVFAWDLDGSSSTTGATNSPTILRVGLVSFISAAPEPSVVLSMPHTLVMQIIFVRPNTTPSNQQEATSGSSMVSQRSSRVEVLTLTYDTAKNFVSVFAPSKKQQKSRYSALEEMVNKRFRNTQACTLVQFISHLRQGGPVIQQQQHAQPSQQIPQPQTQQLQLQQTSQQMHQPMQQ